MNRNEGLKFIQKNSRLVRKTLLNPPFSKDEEYEANYIEQRLGNNGTPFIINDYGKHGWDIYFLFGSAVTQDRINEFCAKTGVKQSGITIIKP